MRSINKRFVLGSKVDYPASIMERRDFYPVMDVSFCCCNCRCNVQVNFEPCKVQTRLFDLYNLNFVDIDNLINGGVGMPMISQINNRPYLVINGVKIAQYTIFECKHCNTDFLFVFGIDEIQSGRDICSVSGLWELKYKN